MQTLPDRFEEIPVGVGAEEEYRGRGTGRWRSNSRWAAPARPRPTGRRARRRYFYGPDPWWARSPLVIEPTYALPAYGVRMPALQPMPATAAPDAGDTAGAPTDTPASPTDAAPAQAIGGPDGGSVTPPPPETEFDFSRAAPPPSRPAPIPAARLQWPQATPEQIAFMRSVYQLHVARAAKARSFVGDVPPQELDWVDAERRQGERLRRPAAAALRTLLSEARAALARERNAGNAQARGVSRIGITSGYRSASQQFALWEHRFAGYYRDTATERARLPGGPHGAQAADYLSRHIGRWLAAPGYSNHNRGLAADLVTVEGGTTFSASHTQVTGWRSTWLFNWLMRHAARFGFYQNPSINEPWHWEYHPPTNGGGAPVRQESSTGKAISTSSVGREEIARFPVLDRVPGPAPALVLRWNQSPSTPTAVDVVVHFHGYAMCGQPAQLLLPRDIEPISGLDFANPDSGGGGPRRLRPTLALLPRGTQADPAHPRHYTFPSLTTPAGLKELIDAALDHFGHRSAAARPRLGRLILTAHSGGGAALLRSLAHVNPHEVHLFDALYGWPAEDYAALARWVQTRIRNDQAALSKLTGQAADNYMRTQGGALRCVFGPTTCERSHALAAMLAKTLAETRVTSLGTWYRVERTLLQHCAIPRRYGWRLLTDASAALPDVAALGKCEPRPTATVRSAR